MSVYAIALINIKDRDRYGDYEAGFMDIFAKHGGKLLAVDETPKVKEGAWPWTRTVLLEFESSEEFDRWYESDEYQALAQHRFAASEGAIAVLKSLA